MVEEGRMKPAEEAWRTLAAMVMAQVPMRRWSRRNGYGKPFDTRWDRTKIIITGEGIAAPRSVNFHEFQIVYELWPSYAGGHSSRDLITKKSQNSSYVFGFLKAIEAVGGSVLQPEAADDEPFNPGSLNDARDTVFKAIKLRRGQAEFRARLLEAYQRKCAISSCAVLPILEAAHIQPYRGSHTNHPSNGLLLRADLHTLFDCSLITIDPRDMTVAISRSLETSEYAALKGMRLRTQQGLSKYPNVEVLEKHFQSFTIAEANIHNSKDLVKILVDSRPALGKM